LRWLVSNSVRTCPFFQACQTFWDGLEPTAVLGSESSTLLFGLTLHMSSYTLHSEAVTADSTALGYGRFSDSLLQRRRFTSCASVKLLHLGALTEVQCHLQTIRPCFREPFGEGSRRTPASLTPLARVLDAIVRRTLLPRLGYREGLTRMQLWVVHHLISHTSFDIWDLMLCEMEDTLAEGFKGHRHLPYAHWICLIIRSACELPTEI
jgi:hypothetical protein